MNFFLALAWTVIYYVILYPIILLVQLLINIVLPLVRAAEFVLLPFAHLGRFVLDALLFPFNFVSRFETLYTYVGVAALVGVIVGSLLHLSSTTLISNLDLEHSPDLPPRSNASYGRARRKKKADSFGLPLRPDWLGNSSGQQQGMLSPPTILEEEDSES